MAGRRIACAVLALATAAPVYAQSLGELARQEEARRVSARPAVRSLSNTDLEPSANAAPAVAAPACYMSKKLDRCVSAEEMVANSVAGSLTRENAPFEQKWRQDAGSLRSQIEKTRRSIATLEGVVADAGRSAADRKAAEQTLAGARQSLAGLERQWAKLETNAGNQRIPRAWIEPIPDKNPQQ